MQQPPRLAMFLVTRLTAGTDGALGDLVEQFQSGRSALWFWRQAIGLVSQRAARDMQQHPVLTAGLMVGAALLTLLEPLVRATITGFDEQLFVRGIRWFYVSGPQLPSTVMRHPWLITAVLYAAAGWSVGRVSGHRKAAAVLVFTASVFACGVLSPLTQIRIDMTSLSYHFALHGVSVDAIPAILAQHFIVNGTVDFMNVFVFNVVILPLMTLIGGVSARVRGGKGTTVSAARR